MDADNNDTIADADADAEDVEAFRLRARGWMAENLPLLPEGVDNRQLSLADDTGGRDRRLQRQLFEAGFAGLCFPSEYGGQGLSRAHQRAFTQESLPYQMPTLFNVPTLSILAPTLLDFGTEEQKERHIPAILRGEELWVQFLSEPSGGSDLAGSVTQATRDGDVFIMSGSKIWSSGAHRSDYAMCLARTDPHVPKHQGLTMFIVKIHQPGIEVQPIGMVNGLAEFCQEFFDDVAIPAEQRHRCGQRRMDRGLTAPLSRARCRGRGIALRQRYGHGPRRRGRTAGGPGRPGQGHRPGRRRRGPPAGGRGPGQRPGPGPADRADDPGHPGRGPTGAGRIAGPAVRRHQRRAPTRHRVGDRRVRPPASGSRAIRRAPGEPSS